MKSGGLFEYIANLFKRWAVLFPDYSSDGSTIVFKHDLNCHLFSLPSLALLLFIADNGLPPLYNGFLCLFKLI
jgi:hypothetical protein